MMAALRPARDPRVLVGMETSDDAGVFRIDDVDPEHVVGEKIDRALRRLGPEMEETRPLLRYLLSLDPGDPTVLAMDPRRRHAARMRRRSKSATDFTATATPC